MRISGPAIVEERGAVTIIAPKQEAEIDPFDSLVIQIGA
jgi:hypothetical protein